MVAVASAVVLAFVVMQAAQPAAPTHVREVTLALPHALRPGETVWLLVEVGAIGHDQVRLTAQDGRLLGSLSAYGAGSGQAGGTYTVPVPAEDLGDGRLVVRVAVMRAGVAQRAPTTEEVKSLRLVVR